MSQLPDAPVVVGGVAVPSGAAAQPGDSVQPDVVNHPEALREVMAEVRRLREEVAHLRSQLTTLTGHGLGAAAGGTLPGAASSATPAGDEAPVPAAAGTRWSRRGVLLGALGAAAGATAGVVGATPAAAGVGAMQFGTTNVADGSATGLTSSNGFQTITVANSGIGNAVHARAIGSGIALLATAATGKGVRAESLGGNGIEGISRNQLGVLGDSPGGSGVEGRGAIFGVVGRTNFGTAVFGISQNRTGVEAFSGGEGAGVKASSNTGPAGEFRSTSGPTLRLTSVLTGVPTAGSWMAGDIVAVQTAFGTSAELWVCVSSGIPGTWRQIAGPTVAGGFVPIRPARVYDSRWGSVPGVTTGILQPGTTRTISVADGRDSRGSVVAANVIPRGTPAVTLNLAVVDTVGRGNLALVPDARLGSESSSINWSSDNQVLANGLTLAINGFARTLDIICRSNRTNVFVDITGYFSGV